MKKLFHKIDKPLLFMTTLYIILGLVMILSASSVSAVLRYDVSPYYFFGKQLIYIVLSLIAGLIIMKIPTKKYNVYGVIYVIIALILLCLVFFFGIIAGGAQSWLDFGFFNLQPTEFAKTSLIIFMGVFYEYSLKKQKPFTYNLIPIIVAIVMFVLIAKQPDLGGALIVAGITFFTFLTIPFPKKSKVKIIKHLGIALIVGVFILLYAKADLFNSSQLKRLQFQAPCSRYMDDTGYQVCNGFIAFHNGGLFGVGLGNSTQKYLYLPEAHTDFIFPIIVEELGLLTGILVVLGYFYILYRILRLAKRADSIRNQIICYGTFTYFLLHLLVNFLGILALIPLTGVPLPFLSYGGSFCINNILMMCVLQKISIETYDNEQNRAIANL